MQGQVQVEALPFLPFLNVKGVVQVQVQGQVEVQQAKKERKEGQCFDLHFHLPFDFPLVNPIDNRQGSYITAYSLYRLPLDSFFQLLNGWKDQALKGSERGIRRVKAEKVEWKRCVKGGETVRRWVGWCWDNLHSILSALSLVVLSLWILLYVLPRLSFINPLFIRNVSKERISVF